MSATAWPNPTSTYQLRVHLDADHDADNTRREAGWFELDQAHRHAHRVGATHAHEPVR